jgi:hypothetical protein
MQTFWKTGVTGIAFLALQHCLPFPDPWELSTLGSCRHRCTKMAVLPSTRWVSECCDLLPTPGGLCCPATVAGGTSSYTVSTLGRVKPQSSQWINAVFLAKCETHECWLLGWLKLERFYLEPVNHASLILGWGHSVCKSQMRVLRKCREVIASPSSSCTRREVHSEGWWDGGGGPHFWAATKHGRGVASVLKKFLVWWERPGPSQSSSSLMWET